MNLFLLTCIFLMLQKSSIAGELEYGKGADTRKIRSFGYGAQDFSYDNSYGSSPNPLTSIWSSLLSSVNILPHLRCEYFRCGVSLPSLMGAIPQFDIEVGITPDKLLAYTVLYKNGQLYFKKTLGLVGHNICIPFTDICIKITHIQLPWGPICVQVMGQTFPCFEMNGIFPSFFYPNPAQLNQMNGVNGRLPAYGDHRGYGSPSKYDELMDLDISSINRAGNGEPLKKIKKKRSNNNYGFK